MNLKPVRDRLIVRLTEPETVSKGGIFIPDAATEKPNQGEVLAVGSGRLTKDGQSIAMEVKTGDKVLFGKNAGQTVKVNSVEYHILVEDDVMAIIDQGE
jgi:chaperonin GroES